MDATDLCGVTVDLGHDRRGALLDLIDGWAAHVVRLYRERFDSAPDASSAWGAHDFIAALYIRDRVQSGLEQFAREERLPYLVQVADELFRSFTETDGEHTLRDFQPALPLTPWWWTRIPLSGPVRAELA